MRLSDEHVAIHAFSSPERSILRVPVASSAVQSGRTRTLLSAWETEHLRKKLARSMCRCKELNFAAKLPGTVLYGSIHCGIFSG